MRNRHKTLHNAYAIVRERCSIEHRRQKSFYNEKVHGKSYNVGDMVWLHSTVVPRGKSRKLHHTWKGPFEIVEPTGESDYRIKAQKGKRTQVVHFDRLKPCTPRTRLAQSGGAEQQRSTSNPCKPHVLGEQLNIESDDDEPPPPRDQQPLIEAPPPVVIEPPQARRQSLIPV